MKESKSLLVTRLSEKVVTEADKAYEDKNYTQSVFDKWKKEHFRNVG
jgi:hypothetical protein